MNLQLSPMKMSHGEEHNYMIAQKARTQVLFVLFRAHCTNRGNVFLVLGFCIVTNGLPNERTFLVSSVGKPQTQDPHRTFQRGFPTFYYLCEIGEYNWLSKWCGIPNTLKFYFIYNSMTQGFVLRWGFGLQNVFFFAQWSQFLLAFPSLCNSLFPPYRFPNHRSRFLFGGGDAR